MTLESELDGASLRRIRLGLVDGIQIVVGDRLVELVGGTDRLLTEGDSVVLLPPFEGGAA